MAKKILSVGVEIPGGEIENEDFFSRRSLLDADIVVYLPEISSAYGDETYHGKICLSDDRSFQAREALKHWRSEILAAVDAGKLVIVFLRSPEVMYAATGETRYSGTGRNARQTRIVEELDVYSSLPVSWQFVPASGTEMALTPQGRFLASYWQEFSPESAYELFLAGDVTQPVLKTVAGDRVVGACSRKGRGALLALPVLDLSDDSYLEEVEGEDDFVWSTKAKRFGKRFASAVVELAATLASEVTATPRPQWTSANQYQLPEEAELEKQIELISARVAALDEERSELSGKLDEAGALRGLLFEQGKLLEAAVLQALRLFRFEASNLSEGESEFDAVFIGPEGRFLGEVEGKDNKAINIDKLSQLERNLGEDFAREETEQHAKGVLFGNAYRLTPISERDAPFTEKCKSGARRLGVALVHTPDLFLPCRYLKTNADADYARRCREAIFATEGDLVVFPLPPSVG